MCVKDRWEVLGVGSIFADRFEDVLLGCRDY